MTENRLRIWSARERPHFDGKPFHIEVWIGENKPGFDDISCVLEVNHGNDGREAHLGVIAVVNETFWIACASHAWIVVAARILSTIFDIKEGWPRIARIDDLVDLISERNYELQAGDIWSIYIECHVENI